MVTTSLNAVSAIQINNRCSLNCATRSIDFCAAFFNVSSFPVFAWLPQCVLFNSSLICVLGILWQRQLLGGKTTTLSHEWLHQSIRSLCEVLHIFEYCALGNEQCQRHYLVLQGIFSWLQEAADSVPIDRSVSPTNIEIVS
jgi:hypothetical protein